mgnify:CR=1 FL=1
MFLDVGKAKKKRGTVCIIGLLLCQLLLAGCGNNMEESIQSSAGNNMEESIQSSVGNNMEESIQSSVNNTEREAEAYGEEPEEETPDSIPVCEAPSNWREAYEIFLHDWKAIESYGDFAYLDMYFEDRYFFDQYFLCDIDENGTPELFLHSTGMDLTAVFTYTEEPVFLMYDRIYGLNFETDEVVINGHWHGAGGSGIDEWVAYRIEGDMAYYSMYIDFMDISEEEGGSYSRIYREQTDEYVRMEDRREFDILYADHVEPCVLAENYRLYDTSDPSGLDDIQ